MHSMSSHVPRLLNSEEHWACMVLKKGSTCAESQAVIFDGLYKEEIQDCGKTVFMYFIDQWFGKAVTREEEDERKECLPEWGRVAGQEEGWSCGHRIAIVFEALAAAGAFLPDSDNVGDYHVGPEKFDFLKTAGSFQASTLAALASAAAAPSRGPATPQRRGAQGGVEDDALSPPAVAHRAKRKAPKSNMEPGVAGGRDVLGHLGTLGHSRIGQ